MKQLLVFLILLSSTFCFDQGLSYVGRNNICLGNGLWLRADGDTSYAWAHISDPDSILSTDDEFFAEPTEYTTYFLYGSSDTIEIDVWVSDCDYDCKYFVPTVFTPDGDLFNENFTPIINCGDIIGIRMTICNRMGKVVYDKTDYNWLSWDGRHMETGVLLSQGLYGWQVSFVKEDGEVIRLQGHVFLLM